MVSKLTHNLSFTTHNSKFSEAKLELAFTELLENKGYPHYLGNAISRSDQEVLIEDDLQNYLLNRYKKQQLTETEAKSIILQHKSLSASDLYESNTTIMRWLADGFILKREDRNQKDIHIELVDYKGLNAQRQSAKLDNIAADPEAEYGKDYDILKDLCVKCTSSRLYGGIPPESAR